MFHVGRYDPREEEKQKQNHQQQRHKKRSRRHGDNTNKEHDKKKKQHRRHDADKVAAVVYQDSSDSSSESDDDSSKDQQPTTTLRVIAEEAKPSASQRHHLLTNATADEAFDDLDIEPDVLENHDSVEADEEGNSGLSEEVRTALNMSSLPIEEAAASWKLAPFLIANLKRDGYENFFPIQSLVIPDVITTQRHGYLRARDVCVASPTGSGKTLAFVLPVLNALANRVICRLRALVVLPSRDLALQVYKVFERYAQGSNLRVGIAIGQSDFKAEQKSLTIGSPSSILSMLDAKAARERYEFDKGNVELALEAFSGTNSATQIPGAQFRMPDGGRSAVDVLVATPGRLVDHLDRTPGFTLQHLQFLVIDEADRLLNQSYHSFVSRVMSAAHAPSVNARRRIDDQEKHGLQHSWDGTSFIIDPITWRRDEDGDAGMSSSASMGSSVCQKVQLRKLLFSATMTKDPQKLAALGLVNPKHFDAHRLRDRQETRTQRYSMPSSLTEHVVECTAEQKPLVLLALLLEYLNRKPDSQSTSNTMVVFTSSLDSTHRLARLLQLLWKIANFGDSTAVAEFSSALSQSQRSALLKRCSSSKDSPVSVIVCSDGMSRGLDLAVPCIFNYDVPSFAKTYVHR
jgi:ATP-dependent RNA helicase DDX51/DBP6